MISRRSFLYASISMPLLTLFGRTSAEELTHIASISAVLDEPSSQAQPAAFGIQGWQEETTQNGSSSRFISLSASWKSGWL